MTAVDVTRRPVARDRYGRYLIWPDNKTAKKPVAMTRVTTLAQTLSDKFGLEQWKIRSAISGLIHRPDLLQLAATHLDDRSTLDQVGRDAIEAGDTKKAATVGTSLHRWAEMIDRGEDITQFGDLAPLNHMSAYITGLQQHDITVLEDHIEQICINNTLDVAGTYDRLVHWDGRTVVADLKTGSYLNELEIAIQLACYANCSSIYTVDEDGLGHHRPPPPIDLTVGLILHLPQNSTDPHLEVHTVDLKAGWEAAQIASQVRAWRKKTLTGTCRPSVPSRHDLDVRIATIKHHPEALAALPHYWPAGIPTFKQSDEHTADQYRQIAEAISRLEADYEIPF